MSGNPAVRPQVGVSNVTSVIDTGNTDLTGSGVSLIPSGNGTWTEFTSNVEATCVAACEDAGYIKCDFEFAAGTVTSVRIPAFLTT
jgi:hypothetical protein